MTESDPVAVEATISAPFETVWNALRDPAEIRRWHGWHYEGLDAEIDEIYLDTAEIDEAAGTIAIADGSRFIVEGRGEQTVVRVTMPGPTGYSGWEGFYDDIREGWASFVQQLRFALERHPGEDRRTLQFGGDGAGPLFPGTLGLASGDRPGDPYSGTTPWGETWTGETYFRNEHQIALTVDGYGPGLVILHAKPPAGENGHGGGRAIVTTYGLDDAAHAALEDRWSAWWREQHAPVR